MIEELAYGLRKRFSIGSNGSSKDVVVLFSSGQVAYPAMVFGIIGAGGVASLASPSSTPSELARQIRSGSAKVVICSEDNIEISRRAVKEYGSPVTLLVLRSAPDFSLRIDGTDWEQGELRGTTMQERLPWKRITDPEELEKSLIMLLYSSGTTGEPKGVMLSHRNFVSQLVIISTSRRERMAKLVAEGVVPTPVRSLAHLPAAHIAGVMSYIIAPAFSGGTVFWMKKYNWPDFMEFNKSLRITSCYTVPSIYLRIAKDPAVKDHFKTLVYASAGAAPVDGALQRAASKKVGVGETKVTQTYGLSETTGAVTTATGNPDEEVDQTGSISSLLPNLEMRFVDDNDKVGSMGPITITYSGSS
jgi:4-coumarate--CoA ligase